jgi:hypothetical protein
MQPGMASETSKRRRSSKSARLSRHTRAAYQGAQSLLRRIDEHPALRPLGEEPEAQQLIDQLRQDVDILKVAPTLRIGAARRLQGASSRRRTASYALFAACAEVRRRVKLRFRGPRHLALRRAFGEGTPASPAKPESVLVLAEQILSAAPAHATELRQVRIGPPTVQRLTKLRDNLRACAPERVELRAARRQVSDSLAQIADRVGGLCSALLAIAARVCPHLATELAGELAELMPHTDLAKPAKPGA